MRRTLPALLLAAAASCTPEIDPPPETARIEAELARSVRAWLADDRGTARADGYTYAVDVAQLLLWSARAGDEELYDELRAHALRHLLVDDPDDPFTRGFVLWRHRPGEPRDASGTTEALRLAEGLWRGAEAFGRTEDRRLARLILDGYARHAYVDGGVWLIRNYFKLETRAFATNSYLVDYAPDFVAEVAAETGDPTLADVAERSYDLLVRAQTEGGLVYDLVQPEVATLMGPGLVIFSPNDVVQLSNAATAAEQGVRGRPHVALAVLGLAKEKLPRLDVSYLGRTGDVAVRRRPGMETYASLTRIAVHLRDDEALAELLPELLAASETTARHPPEPRLYVASELLLALRAVLEG